MYKDFLRAIARFQTKHYFLVMLLILAITIFMIGGVSKVRTVASLEKMMPTGVEEIKAFNTLRDNYLGQDMVAIVMYVDPDSTDFEGVVDIRDRRVFEYTDHLNNLIRSEADIRETYAASDIILYSLSSMGQPVDKLYGSGVTQEMYDSILSNEEISSQMSNFINNDYTISIIIATTDISADDERMKLLASRIIEDIESAGSPPGVKVTVTGTPVIQQKLGVLIAKDRTVTQNISTLLVFVITMLLFGTFTSALVPIIIVTISVNWLYGIMGYTNLPISTLAGGVAAMVIGIGIDYAIHMMNKFKSERKLGKSIQEALEESVVEKGMALSGAAIATILAFLAFLFGSMPEMNRFGILMAIGVGAAFLLSLFGLPSLLIIEEKIVHFLRKRMRFGVEGELTLYSKDEIHPEDHEIVEVSEKDLKTLLKTHKVCRKKVD